MHPARASTMLDLGPRMAILNSALVDNRRGAAGSAIECNADARAVELFAVVHGERAWASKLA